MSPQAGEAPVADDASRRRFLQAASVAATGLVIGFALPGVRRALAQAGRPAPLPPPSAFLRIGADDTFTVLLSHAEMGQGVWTTLPLLIAEELDADLAKFRVEHAPAAPVYAHTAFGLQMTGGSSSTWSEFVRYREVGALARALLVEAAARRFGVAASACTAADGVVACGDRKATYGELAEAAAKLPMPANVTLKEPARWRYIGKPTKRLDAPEKTTGRAVFGIDVTLDGLLTAVVARAPVFGATVESLDATAARAVPGVVDVVQVPSGVAVLASDFWAAKRGRDALRVAWQGGAASVDTTALRAELRGLAEQPGAVAATAGDPAAAFAQAAKTFDVDYVVPYLAHAPMEPANCTVRVADGRCEIWTGTQFQAFDQQVAAAILGLEAEDVAIHTTFLGGGFGRRATPTSDFVAEAVHVAKAAGRPVKVVWTREDDIRGGYYRPMYVHRVRIGVDEVGMPIGWEHAIAGQSITAGTPLQALTTKDGVDRTSVEGAADSPYLDAVANRRVVLHSPRVGVPVLWWRSVGHSHTAFVMESLMDELAANAGVDPLDYRRRLLGQRHPRHRAVLELAAQKAGWTTPLPKDRARGVAVHASFGSYVAQVAEVSVSGGAIRVHRVVCAIDCGVAVNPDGVAAQMESGIAFGLSAALYGELTLEGGRVQQSNFHDYPVLRMDAMPVVDVHVVPSKERPGGVGEPGVPPIAPAVANAVFALTRARLRELPLRLPAAGAVA
jgi:isoquinoline 1-oxidoreductase beta subunit